MTAVWASHHEELCGDGVVAPPVCAHMVVPRRWVVLMGATPRGQPWTPAAGPPWVAHRPTNYCATRCSI